MKKAKRKQILAALILAIAGVFPALSRAECVELAPKEAPAPTFRQPRLYMCQATIPGAETNEEGYRLSGEKAQAEADAFVAIQGCRNIGADQTKKFRSFCDPIPQCTNFTTYLYFSCGHFPSENINGKTR